MTPEELRALLGAAAEPVRDDEVRVVAAVEAGHHALRRHARRTAALTTLAVTAGALAVTGVVVGGRSGPDTSVVLGCAQGLGTQGAGLVRASATDVTLAVSNPTRDVQPVTSGGTTVYALPGLSEVTLPLAAVGRDARCGSGGRVRLTVRHEPARCSRVASALGAAVDRGSLVDLTRARVADLPLGAQVTAVGTPSARRHVEVRSGGSLVAEAVWHEMPGADEWHLESVTRCS